MIKNFKIFERLKFKYSTGDYVKIDDEIFAKIIDLKSWEDMDVPDYYCEIFFIKDNFRSKSWTDENQIKRKLTEEEIERVKIIEDAKKYNL